MSPANELQAAIYTALLSDSDVAALVSNRIYDRVPMGGDIAPFVTFDSATERPDDTDCTSISDHTFTLSVWSEEQGGFKEAKAIAFAIKRVLHNSNLDLPTHGLIDMQLTDSRALRDPDGITSRIIATYEAMIEEN